MTMYHINAPPGIMYMKTNCGWLRFQCDLSGFNLDGKTIMLTAVP